MARISSDAVLNGLISDVTIGDPQQIVTTVPGPQALHADTTDIDGISVNDPNDGATVTVLLSDASGLLWASDPIGGSISGSGTTELTIVGTVGEVNAALGTLVDTVAAGPDTITVATSDTASSSDNQMIAVSGYRFAEPSISSVVFGNHHVGDIVSQTLSVSNVAPPDGYSESLDAAVVATSGGISASGSVNLLAAGATDNSDISVKMDTSTAGNKGGYVTIDETSDGDGSSGLGTTALGEEDVSVTGAVYRYATASVLQTVINFGTLYQGNLASQAITITNTAAADGYSESLDAAAGPTTGEAIDAGSFGLLAAGSSDSTDITVGIDTSSSGVKTGFATIYLTSDGEGTSGLGQTSLTPETIEVIGTVYGPALPAIAPLALGNHHLGDSVSQGLVISNVAPANGYAETSMRPLARLPPA